MYCLLFVCVNFDGKSVIPIFFCNVIMVSVLYVRAKRTGWKIRPRPETAILTKKKKKKKKKKKSKDSKISRLRSRLFPC